MLCIGAPGCGNCVLKIYTNNSGLPAYELCGENKSYAGMTILSQGNLMRLKYDSLSYWIVSVCTAAYLFL